ncbi:MAG: 50S ribosomal protein L6 [Syntrophorhabdaceae bacterium PtaU1.Bin034]|jgi:large subunit ribosomal protein L6|nr:MAG: 50S ribosomal protein L6 [Syntrophorhabdaceae bacterium PtaU1.Bin034]
MSRIGKKPIALPAGVTVEVKDGWVSVSGQKGSLKRPMLDGVELDMADNIVTLRRTSDDKKARSYHGLMRTLVANMVQGVSAGFEKKLEIVGIGYRSELKGNSLALFLGYSHPIDFPLPPGISAEIEKQTLVTLKGVDKELVGQTAAKIRDLRKPDPYKGKGVKYAGEVLRKKAGKTGK